MGFEIVGIEAGGGRLGLSPLPLCVADVAAMVAWRPALVLSLTEAGEMGAEGSAPLAAAVALAGIGWDHLPIADYGTPEGETRARWPAVSLRVLALLSGGGRVLVHCRGGCGRSGMVVLRLMAETGEAPDAALARLRAARPCAVETAAQELWAGSGLR